MNTTTKKSATISVRLSPNERTDLIELARTEDRTLSQTIRRLLRNAFTTESDTNINTGRRTSWLPQLKLR
jgi:hypothetical protein